MGMNIMKKNDEEIFSSMSLTEEEQRMVDTFSKQIDIENMNHVLNYGSQAQNKMAAFSEATLKNIQTKDLGKVGDLISKVVMDLQDTTQEEKKGFFGFFKKKTNDLQEMKLRYESASENIDAIIMSLEEHQKKLTADIEQHDQLYKTNLQYFKELSMYILAGKKALKEAREGKGKQLTDLAQKTGNVEDIQIAKDYSEQCDRFEKKLHDLDLTRTISMQMAPQIRLLQNNDSIMVEKIQSTIVNTIPLWKSQMIIAIGLEHSRLAIEAQNQVTDLTNRLLKQNAEQLKMATIDSTKASERGIVDIETLKHTNSILIQTFDEVLKIQDEGRKSRRNAELEMRLMEQQLKKSLLKSSNYIPSESENDKPKYYTKKGSNPFDKFPK